MLDILLGLLAYLILFIFVFSFIIGVDCLILHTTPKEFIKTIRGD